MPFIMVPGRPILLIAISLLAVTACLDSAKKSHQPTVSPVYHIVFQADMPPGTPRAGTLDSIKNVLERRMDGLLFYSDLSVNPGRRTLTLDLIGKSLQKNVPSESELAEMTGMLTTSGSLGFYDVYSMRDEEIRLPMQQAVSELNGLPDLLKINASPYSAVIGFAAPGDMAAIDSLLEVVFSKYRFPAGITRVWSGRPALVAGQNLHELYFLAGTAQVNGNHILEAAAAPSQQNPKEAVINLTFNEIGTKIFGDMTTAAAENGNRQIAIVFNGYVLSAPNVINPITAGKSQLAGSFTPSQAISLAHIIQAGQYPCPLKVLSAHIIHEQ